MIEFVSRLESGHLTCTIKPSEELPVLQDDEDGGGDTVHCHDVPVPGDGQPRHDVNVADGDLSDKVSVSGEDLHSAPLVAPVTHNILSSRFHHSHFPKNKNFIRYKSQVKETRIRMKFFGLFDGNTHRL